MSYRKMVTMKKDLLIGAVDLYDWSNVRVWAKSIRETGFAGDIALIAYRIKNEVEFLHKCKEYNVEVFSFEHDSFARPIEHNAKGRDTQCHQLRFFHAWQLMNWFVEMEREYRYVVMTDVKDVWFQNNPFDLLAESDGLIFASSENISYKHEVWGYDNLLQGFGGIVANEAVTNEWEIFNVGVLGGEVAAMKELFFSIYSMTYGRYIPSDQSAFNTIVHLTSPYKFKKTTHEDRWACQCGTTIDPQKRQYKFNWLHKPPEMKENSVVNCHAEPYAIVHQWDRVPELKSYLENKY